MLDQFIQYLYLADIFKNKIYFIIQVYFLSFKGVISPLNIPQEIHHAYQF